MCSLKLGGVVCVIIIDYQLVNNNFRGHGTKTWSYMWSAAWGGANFEKNILSYSLSKQQFASDSSVKIGPALPETIRNKQIDRESFFCF